MAVIPCPAIGVGDRVGVEAGVGTGAGADGLSSSESSLGTGVGASPMMVMGTWVAPAVKSLLYSSRAPSVLAALVVLSTWVVAVNTVVTTTVPKGGILPKNVVKSVQTNKPGLTMVGVGGEVSADHGTILGASSEGVGCGMPSCVAFP